MVMKVRKSARVAGLIAIAFCLHATTFGEPCVVQDVMTGNGKRNTGEWRKTVTTDPVKYGGGCIDPEPWYVKVTTETENYFERLPWKLTTFTDARCCPPQYEEKSTGEYFWELVDITTEGHCEADPQIALDSRLNSALAVA